MKLFDLIRIDVIKIILCLIIIYFIIKIFLLGYVYKKILALNYNFINIPNNRKKYLSSI